MFPTSSFASFATTQKNTEKTGNGKRMSHGSPEGSSKVRKVSQPSLDDSKHQSPFRIRRLRALTIKLSPNLDEESVHQLAYLFELPRGEIEASKRPLLAFMEEAEKRGRVTSSNVEVLIDGLKKLAPSEKIEKAVKMLKDYNNPLVKDKGPELRFTLDQSSNKIIGDTKWQKFCDWCSSKDVLHPAKVTCDDVMEYLVGQYPRIKVVTISRHFSSIQLYRKFNDFEEKRILQVLDELKIKEAERQKIQNESAHFTIIE